MIVIKAILLLLITALLLESLVSLISSFDSVNPLNCYFILIDLRLIFEEAIGGQDLYQCCLVSHKVFVMSLCVSYKTYVKSFVIKVFFRFKLAHGILKKKLEWVG